ncbi:isoprenoid synthase domain-containing protein [Mycena filopes]|nr:isoprenoid synthase domain-containing protein [Mycena filopes]
MVPPRVLHLPDIHDQWPFPVARSPWESEASTESVAWIESLRILPDRQLQRLCKADYGGLAAIAYANFTQLEHLRVACDLVNLLFVFDDLTDEMSGAEAEALAGISLDALRDWQTPRPQEEHPVGEMHRSFSERLHGMANPDILQRFLDGYEDYLHAVVLEACDREDKVIKDTLEIYLDLRRSTGAVTCAFNLLALPLDIPGEVLDDSRIRHLELLALDLVCVGNDILSVNVEQARGDVHNAVIVVMKQRGLSIQDALDFVGKWYQDHVQEFLAAVESLPRFHSVAIHSGVERYISGMANWVTGNYEWSLKSRRYFPDGKNPRDTAWMVPLMSQHKS